MSVWISEPTYCGYGYVEHLQANLATVVRKVLRILGAHQDVRVSVKLRTPLVDVI